MALHQGVYQYVTWLYVWYYGRRGQHNQPVVVYLMALGYLIVVDKDGNQGKQRLLHERFVQRIFRLCGGSRRTRFHWTP